MNTKLNKNVSYVLIILVLLTLTKIDFRFDEINPGSFVDDAEYYYHVQTIAIDRDLDYSNQMPDTPYRNLNVEDKNKVLPVHSIGVGLFASPFMFISNFLSSIFDIDSLITFNYFIYSFVPVFYLFISFLLINKILQKNDIPINNLLLPIVIAGSGVSYFAFERFSMSHSYEFFGTTLCIYLCDLTYRTKNSSVRKLLIFLLPITMFIVLTIRWSNYFLILIPFFVNIFFPKRKVNLYVKFHFIFGFIVGLGLFLLHTKYLYGIYTVNPSDIFLIVENRISDDYFRFFDLERIQENILFIFKTFFIINFSEEFGFAYFSPILFFGNMLLFYYIFKNEFIKFLLVGFILFFPFFSTLVLNNPGYSYGYRYFYSTIPIFIIIYFLEFNKFKKLTFLILVFSLISLIFQVFFESTPFVVLSTEYVTNSFGLYTKYVNPTILSGMFKSFLIMDSYLNVVFTSFIGVLIIKIISIFTDPILLVSKFRETDDKIINLVDMSSEFSWLMYFIVLIGYFLIARNFLRTSKQII